MLSITKKRFLMERVMGLEPTTLCLEGRCSSQLSYTRKILKIFFSRSEKYLIKKDLEVKIFFSFFRLILSLYFQMLFLGHWVGGWHLDYQSLEVSFFLLILRLYMFFLASFYWYWETLESEQIYIIERNYIL